MCLGIPKITPQIIRALVKMGFKAIRTQVTWHNMPSLTLFMIMQALKKIY